MNIIETNIPDVTESNIPRNKEIIADSIVENVYPLFDEVHKAKLEQVAQLKNRIRTGKTEIKSEKETMQQLMSAYKKEQKISKVLERVGKLIGAGLAHDGSTKNETVILLKIIDKLPMEKLDHQLAKTMQTLNKRFAR